MPSSPMRHAGQRGATTRDNRPAALDTLNLSEGEWVTVVEQIKTLAQAERTGEPRRLNDRVEALGLLRFEIDVRQPGGTDIRFVARSHDLSEDGMGFIHGRYLYPESRCVCWLRHQTDGLTPLPGRIRWCRHVSGVIHLSGVELEEQISVPHYLQPPK